MAVTRIPQATLSQWVAQAGLGTLRWECRYRATDTGGTSTLAMNVAELHPCIQNAGVQRGTGFAKMPGERRIQEGEHSS